MDLPDALWDLVKARAAGVRFGSITISFSEDSGSVSVCTKIDEKVLTNGKNGSRVLKES
jgi:hypothetical protein